ncbi:Membrane protein OS=Streptomyces fumanus OX=67302 GN=GCM10018772_32840 PE=4 SV=1 [Streptomyces fumanus]
MSPHRRATGLLSHAPPEFQEPVVPPWARWLPLVLIALALAVDLPTPGAFSGDLLLALSAMMAACVYSLRMVVLVAVLTSAAGLLVLASDGT